MTEDGKREAVAEDLRIANEELTIAEDLMLAGHCRVAVSRAYFAVFHAVERIRADLT